MNRKLAIVIIIISLLLIAGCGKKECKTRAECKVKGSCFIMSCVKGSCISNEIPDCTCGDAVCDEKTENPCNCEEDCKPACEGDIGDYLTKQCDENKQCITAIREGVQKSKKIDDNIVIVEGRATVMELLGTYTYDNPFDVYSSLFNIKLKIDKKLATIDNIIKKIKIVGHSGTYSTRTKTWENDEVSMIVEKEYNRKLWSESTEFEDEFPIILEEEINESLKKRLWVTIELEYTIVDSRGNQKASNFEYGKELEFEFLKLTARACPPRNEWDDGNLCTTEKCSELTDYFVEHEMRKGCKGNYICETGENSCNSPLDCGPCEGDMGDYLQKICYNLQCKTRLKQDVSVETVSIPDTRIMGQATFLVRTTFNKPFNIRNDQFSISYEAQSLGEAQDFTITTIQVIDKAAIYSLIADQKVDKEFSTIGVPQTVIINPLEQLLTSIDGEEAKKPYLKVFYKYSTVGRTGGLVETTGSYEQALGDLIFINPEVEI